MRIESRLRWLTGLLSAVSSLALAPPLNAQPRAEGFAIDRFDPAERGSDWFSAESLDLRGHQRPALGVVGDWAHKPLVLYDENGDERLAIIENQIFVHVGGSLVLWDRLRLGVNLPLAVFQDGSTGTIGNSSFSTDESTTIGDARLGADLRLVGHYRSPLSLAVGAQVFLPTGSQESFTGDGKVRIAAPRLLAAGDIGSLAYSAKLGFVYRAQDQNFAGEPTGSEVVFAAAAGPRLAGGRLVVGPEIFGSTGAKSAAFFERRATPFELLLGGHYWMNGQVRLGAGAGPGITRGFGAPKLRVVASVEWHPDVPAKQVERQVLDRDGDGVLDGEDACPEVSGIRTDDPKTNGCPAPTDRDGDGVFDAEDACPDSPGQKTDDPKTNGCPPPDRDKDGVLDTDDACPDDPGPKTDDPKTNGCPAPKDTDADSIVDPEDACPTAPGPANADPKKHGCPKARIESGQIRIIERIEFQYNSAQLRKDSAEILGEVLRILEAHPEITKISIEGHTDSKGGDAYNKVLSGRRAAAVASWLGQRGISPKRLESKGFGEERPIDSNDNEEGRQNNRRVEFHIVEQDGKAVAPDGASTAVEEKN
jgi:OOP family OmpA-OmpF porin